METRETWETMETMDKTETRETGETMETKKTMLTRETMLSLPCLAYQKLLTSEFGITVGELGRALQDRHEWKRMVNNYHGTVVRPTR